MARPPFPSAVRAAILVLVVALGLGACGRRGRLEPPPTPESTAAEQARGSKSGIHKRAPNPPIRPPQQPFILDPIL